jgi:hypothetical protein
MDPIKNSTTIIKRLFNSSDYVIVINFTAYVPKKDQTKRSSKRN